MQNKTNKGNIWFKGCVLPVTQPRPRALSISCFAWNRCSLLQIQGKRQSAVIVPCDAQYNFSIRSLFILTCKLEINRWIGSRIYYVVASVMWMRTLVGEITVTRTQNSTAAWMMGLFCGLKASVKQKSQRYIYQRQLTALHATTAHLVSSELKCQTFPQLLLIMIITFGANQDFFLFFLIHERLKISLLFNFDSNIAVYSKYWARKTQQTLIIYYNQNPTTMTFWFSLVCVILNVTAMGFSLSECGI